MTASSLEPISYKITPSDQISLRSSATRPERICSGDMYSGVPSVDAVPVKRTSAKLDESLAAGTAKKWQYGCGCHANHAPSRLAASAATIMLSQTETEALMLGMRWVSTFADKSLALSAQSALAKIVEVLPKAVRDGASDVPLRAGPSKPVTEDLTQLRDAIRRERKLAIVYRDGQARESRRVIWPFAIGYFTEGRILVGYCESQRDYRHFRTDRLMETSTSEERYPRPRMKMFREWRERQPRSSHA